MNEQSLKQRGRATIARLEPCAAPLPCPPQAKESYQMDPDEKVVRAGQLKDKGNTYFK